MGDEWKDSAGTNVTKFRDISSPTFNKPPALSSNRQAPYSISGTKIHIYPKEIVDLFGAEPAALKEH